MIGLVGAGGMASEIFSWILSHEDEDIYFYDDRIKDGKIYRGDKEYAIKNEIDNNAEHIIAVGYPETKAKIIKDKNIKWSKALYHLSCAVGSGIKVDDGSIIYPMCSLSANIEIGMLASINSNVIIGHDVKIGDLFHACPGVVISGNCIIGNSVFMGANSCIKEKITICDNVIIGMGSVVVKNIDTPGIYAGNPAKLIKDI